MSGREQYAPGATFGAEVHKDGEQWTLVLVRELRHPPATVWTELTDPEQLRDRSERTGRSAPAAASPDVRGGRTPR